MTSETDAEFVERMVNEWGEWAGSPANARLFALARRGAAAADRIEQLEAENASLATWQCEFTDGKTGLVYGQGGTTFCIMAKRMQQLEAEVKVWQGHAKTAIWSDSEECKFLTARIEQLEAALREIETLDDQAECCGVGVYSHVGNPPECCNQPLYGIDRAKKVARAALEERPTDPSGSPGAA